MADIIESAPGSTARYSTVTSVIRISTRSVNYYTIIVVGHVVRLCKVVELKSQCYVIANILGLRQEQLLRQQARGNCIS